MAESFCTQVACEQWSKGCEHRLPSLSTAPAEGNDRRPEVRWRLSQPIHWAQTVFSVVRLRPVNISLSVQCPLYLTLHFLSFYSPWHCTKKRGPYTCWWTFFLPGFAKLTIWLTNRKQAQNTGIVPDLEDPQRARMREEHTSYQMMDRMQAFSNMWSVEEDGDFIAHFWSEKHIFGHVAQIADYIVFALWWWCDDESSPDNGTFKTKTFPSSALLSHCPPWPSFFSSWGTSISSTELFVLRLLLHNKVKSVVRLFNKHVRVVRLRRSIVEEAMQCKKKILQNDGVVTSPCARPRKAGHTLLILGGQTFMCDKIYQVKILYTYNTYNLPHMKYILSHWLKWY